MAAQDYVAVVEQLYVSYFGRPADYYGLQSFTAQLDALKAPTDFAELNAKVQADKAGTTALSKLVNSFNASAESAALYGTDNSVIGVSKFVAAIYQNVLGREADVDGLNFWVGEIVAGRLTRANAAMAITDGAMSNTSAQGLLDAKTVENKLGVATNFTAALDTTNEINGFAGDAAAKTARDMLATVKDTTDVAAFQSTIDNTLVAIVTGSVPSTTVALTTGVDTLVGTSGNDTFNSTFKADGTGTLSSFDSVDGGAGNDTLNIVDVTAGDAITVNSSVSVANVETVNVKGTGTVSGDFTGWTGVTKLNVTEVGGNAASSIKAAATTAVTVVDAAQAAGNIVVSGGSDVTVTSKGAAAAGANTAGISVSGAAGAVSINQTVTAAAGAVSVNGGKSVTIVESATNATHGTTLTQSGATVVGDAHTTTVSVTQSAAVSAVADSAAATESSAVTFGALTAGQTFTAGGITITAVGAVTAGQLAAAFASLTAGSAANANAGVYTATGTLTGWGTGAAGGAGTNVVTFTSTTANSNVADLTLTGTGAGTSSQVISQGAAAGTNGRGGIAAGGVTITDLNSADTTGTKANTITTVTLDSYGTSSINSNALSTLSLANGAAAVTVTDNSTTATATTLNLTVNNLKTGAALTDAKIKTLNLTATGKDSVLNLTGAALTAINVAGDKAIDLTGSTAAAVTAVVSTNTAGVTMALNNGSTGSFGDGADTITVGAITKAVTLGAGDDTLVITAAAGTGGSVDAGAGIDTLATTGTIFAGLTASQAAKYTGFETVAITDALVTANYDASIITGATNFTAANGVAAGSTATAINLGANTTVEVAGDLVTNTGTLAVQMKLDTAADVLNLVLNPDYVDNNNTTADAIARTVNVNASLFETVNVNSTGTHGSITPVNGYKADVVTNTLALTDNDIVTLKVTGDQALSFTSAVGMTKLATVDASANTAGVTINGAAAGASAALSIKGSATAANSLTGGAGNDTIVGGSKADVITGGAGADTLTGNGGNDTFKYAAVAESTLIKMDTITDFVANTYGQGLDGNGVANGSATAAGANAASTKLNGDLIDLHGVAGGFTSINVSVQGNAADAQTFLQNMAADTAFAGFVGAALDSSSGQLYIDVNHNGTVDMVIKLTGVATLNSAAFVL